VLNFRAQINKKPLATPNFNAKLWSVETKKTLGTPKFGAELWNAKQKKIVKK
jgi:hypothetical protein